MKRTLKIIGYVTLASIGLALVASLALLIGAQFSPDVGHAVISAGDTEIEIAGLFDQPLATFLLAWLVVAGALIVAAFAVMFALAATAAALALAVLAVLVAMFIVLSPFILFGLLVWFLVRRARSEPPVSTTAPPAAA
ncbi:MAG: hypothetical protein ACRCWJ_19705 [Casimicrobium sp.]